MITETPFTVKTKDGATIYGVKSHTPVKKAGAIFMVHGLTGDMYSYVFKRAADHFARDYDVYRFNLYDGEDGARQLIDCTLKTHTADFTAILERYAGDYEHCFACGHSYGGPAIVLSAHPSLTAVSLWDPSFDLSRFTTEFSDLYQQIDDQLYTLTYGTAYLIGKAMYDEFRKYDKAHCLALSKLFPAPMQIVTAGDGIFKDDAESWHAHAPKGSERVIVDGTAHCFNEGSTCDALLAECERFFGAIVKSS